MKIYENRLPLKNHFSLTVCLLQKTSLKCPLNAQDSSVSNKKPGDKVLHVMILDEISMVERKTFWHLHMLFKAIKHNSSLFEAVASSVLWTFYSTKQWMKWVYSWWKRKVHFQLHELVEIVRQSSNSDFAQLVYSMSEGK